MAHPIKGHQRRVSPDKAHAFIIAGRLGLVIDALIVLGEIPRAMKLVAVGIGALQHADHLDALVTVGGNAHPGTNAQKVAAGLSRPASHRRHPHPRRRPSATSPRRLEQGRREADPIRDAPAALQPARAALAARSWPAPGQGTVLPSARGAGPPARRRRWPPPPPPRPDRPDKPAHERRPRDRARRSAPRWCVRAGDPARGDDAGS